MSFLKKDVVTAIYNSSSKKFLLNDKTTLRTPIGGTIVRRGGCYLNDMFYTKLFAQSDSIQLINRKTNQLELSYKSVYQFKKENKKQLHYLYFLEIDSSGVMYKLYFPYPECKIIWKYCDRKELSARQVFVENGPQVIIINNPSAAFVIMDSDTYLERNQTPSVEFKSNYVEIAYEEHIPSKIDYDSNHVMEWLDFIEESNIDLDM